MSTIHENMADQNLAQMMAEPGVAAQLVEWHRRLRSGESSVEEFRIYGQTHGRAGKWSMEQLACAVRMHGFVMGGVYVFRTFFLGDGPGPDADRVANQAALRSQLPPFLHVDVWDANLTDQDGMVTWSEPVEFSRSTLQDPDDEFTAEPVLLARGSAPLEIGTTMPSRTLHHLLVDGAVARWPYGADFMQIIVNPSHAEDVNARF